MSCFAGDSIDVGIGSSSPLTLGASYSLQICEAGTTTCGAAMPLAPSDIPLVADPGRHTNERGASLGAFGANNAPLVLTAVQRPMLTAGTQYWITVGSDLNDSVAWNLNSADDVASHAISLDGGLTWFSPSGLTPGAFEVQGVEAVKAVPEPTSLTLLLYSMMAVIGALTWRRVQMVRRQLWSR